MNTRFVVECVIHEDLCWHWQARNEQQSEQHGYGQGVGCMGASPVVAWWCVPGLVGLGMGFGNGLGDGQQTARP